MNSKNKGNTFERKIANLLSKTFEHVLNEDKGFRRNSDSGSYFGGSNSQRTTTHNLDYAVFGDIICPKNFRYTVECKHYKSSPSFQSILNGDVTQWNKWIKQSELDAKSSGKSPFIIVKYNNVSDFVMMKEKQSIQESFTYNNFFIYKLDEVLKLDPSVFFIELA